LCKHNVSFGPFDPIIIKSTTKRHRMDTIAYYTELKIKEKDTCNRVSEFLEREVIGMLDQNLGQQGVVPENGTPENNNIMQSNASDTIGTPTPQTGAQQFNTTSQMGGQQFNTTSQMGAQQFNTTSQMGGQQFSTTSQMGGQQFSTTSQMGGQQYGTSSQMGTSQFGTATQADTQQFGTGLQSGTQQFGSDVQAGTQQFGTSAQQTQTDNHDESNRYFDRVDEQIAGGYFGNGQIPPVSGGKEQKAPKKKKERKPMGFFGKALCASLLAVIFGSVAGGTFYGVCSLTGVWDKNDQQISVPTTMPNAGLIQEKKSQDSGTAKQLQTENIVVTSSDISDVVEQVVPAMVTIVNTCEVTQYDFFRGRSIQEEEEGSGTGIIIGENDTELLIATNHHVVEATKKLEITFNDGTTVEGAVKGDDAEMDLAVVAVPLEDIPEATRDSLVSAKMGDSDHLKLGQPVIVIGNALGIGISVTDGIISGLNREMTSENGQTGTYIQTNAEVNHGNSGGALLNIKGEVIGIVSSKIDGYSVEGMGYAIPISAANPIISDLMEHQNRDEEIADAERGYLGIQLLTMTDNAKLYYGIPDGAYVYEVNKNSAAEKAGIQRYDIITKIDHETISSNDELKECLRHYKAGETVEVKVKRIKDGEYQPIVLSVTLEKANEK